jgi:dephospho-CoA kinase
MLKAGLTGGFGTGKSFAAAIFKELGAGIIDADKLAHKALKKGSATYKKIIAAFGKSVLDGNGLISRKKLGRVVFDNKRKVARLNRIIHPAVTDEIKKRIRSFKGKVLVIDAPLICEAGLCGLIDVLIVVTASKEKQITRCLKKFKIKKADVYKRIACQMPLKTKIKKADYVIDNNGTRKETRMKVIKIWQELNKGARVWR